MGERVDRVPFMKVFGGANVVLPPWVDEYPGVRECIDERLGFEGRGQDGSLVVYSPMWLE